MNYYVYLLICIQKNRSISYVGYTNDIIKRLNSHNKSKGAKSTRGFKWVVIYKKRFLTKSKALSYEFKLKKDKKKRSEILKNNEAKT